MISRRSYLLNKFLIASMFLGVIMILIKEKEGFASHYHNIDYLYKSPMLDKIKRDETSNSLNKSNRLRKNEGSVVVSHNYSKITDNFSIHPCNDNGDYNEMCRNFYSANDVVIGPKKKTCMPGFDCRRVGFYCSLLD